MVEVPVPVEATTSELPRDLQNATLVTHVPPTPAIHLAYGETMASIGQGVVVEAPRVALVEVAAEQLLEAIDIVQVFPVDWWCWCCIGNMTVI